MDLRKYLTVSYVVCTISFLADAWRCDNQKCIIQPLSLRLWKNQIEVSARSVRVQAGSEFSITCDGSCVGTEVDPRLRWYGPDKHWIAYQGVHERIHVDRSKFKRFLKLTFRKVQSSDEGEYICRGWLAPDVGWNMKSLRLVVDPPSKPRPSEISITQRPRKIHTTRIPPPLTTKRTQPPSKTTRPPKPTRTTKGLPPITTTARLPITTVKYALTTQQYSAPSAFTTKETSCDSPRFRCGSGECFHAVYVCDGFPDCLDNSDESNCAAPCSEGMVACTNGDGCVTTLQICDGITQCRDGSDENPDVCNQY